MPNPSVQLLVWDEVGEHKYEMGTDRGVLWVYDQSSKTYGGPQVWNGLTGVDENPDGGDVSDVWADNILYAGIRGAEKDAGTIKAYTYPDDFMKCDGSASISTGIYVGQQERVAFAFSYRTMIGNELDSDLGYKIHIHYGCTCSPSSKDWATINNNPDPVEMSWDYTATPVPINLNNLKPSAHLIIDSTKVSSATLQAIENRLYDATSTTVPMPEDILNLVVAG